MAFLVPTCFATQSHSTPSPAICVFHNPSTARVALLSRLTATAVLSLSTSSASHGPGRWRKRERADCGQAMQQGIQANGDLQPSFNQQPGSLSELINLPKYSLPACLPAQYCTYRCCGGDAHPSACGAIAGKQHLPGGRALSRSLSTCCRAAPAGG